MVSLVCSERDYLFSVNPIYAWFFFKKRNRKVIGGRGEILDEEGVTGNLKRHDFFSVSGAFVAAVSFCVILVII